MKSLFLSLFLFATATLVAQTDYSFVYNADSIIKKGVRLYEEKKYAESIKEYKKVDAIDPKYPSAQYEIAMSLFALEKTDSLKSHFERIYKSDMMKKLPTLYTLYGSYLSDEKKYAESEKIFKEGLLTIPNSSNHLYNLAILYYREEKFQECIDVLEKIVAQNPNSASSHYLLGVVALDSGKIAEGSMALLSYLVLSPTGKYAKNAVLKLNAKFGENFLEKKNYVFSKTGGDNFEELETILRNQLPLRNAYKIESKIDDVVTRQVQAILEYCQTHQMGPGFFETTYQKQIEGFSYYMLLGLEDQMGKTLVAQKKKIESFNDNFIGKDFWKIFAKRKMDIFGTEKEVIVYLQNGIPNLIGTMVDGKREGRFKLLNKYENLDADLQFENNELNGLQKYYEEDGKISEEKSFLKGKLEGKRTVYYPNGNISLEENYHDGELEGKSTSYNVNGGINCDGNFSKGELNGTLNCLHPNGAKKSESNYVNGKIDGTYTTYNKVGDIISTEKYANGELSGKYTKYYDGKAIEEEADYVDGKVVGSFKKYYSNQKLKAEYVYTNKKITSAVEYHPTGVKSSESIYNDKEEIVSTTYFNELGEKYYDEIFNSKEIKFIKQYSKNNPKPTEINLARKSFEIKTLDDKVIITGTFERGKRNGEWKYNFPTGQLQLSSNYVKGNQVGLSKSYGKNGNPYSFSNYVNDTLQGRNDIFDSRGLKKIFYYSKGELNGPFKAFYSDGTLLTEGFYANDELFENRKTYSQTGKILFDDSCYKGITLATDVYNYKGEKETTIVYSNKTGTFSHTFNSGIIKQSYDLKNGILDGSYSRKDKFNKPIIEAEYKSGLRHNTYKEYSPNETLLIEQTYYNGELNGTTKNYDLAGNLKTTSEYTFGDENGKTIRYYHTKSKLYEYNQLDNNMEGDFTYYNQKGEPLVSIFYLNNAPQYYMKRSKTGQLTEKVMIVNETGIVTSNYANGKIAIQFTFDKGNKQGPLIINNELGKPEYSAFYRNDFVHNDRIEYYANGNIYVKEHFVDNDYEGLQEYFKEDGKPWIKAEYKNDELHGKTQLFTNGILTTTKKYDSDFLVDISK